MRSVMAHSFAQVPRANIPRSKFNRSHGYKSTFDADWLIPVYVDDVVPGDTFNLNMNFFARLATPEFPIMDNLYLDSFWFFVPYRLVWTNWTKMHGEQDDPDDSIDYTVPSMTLGSSNSTGSLYDYMGLPGPNGVVGAITGLNMLPFRAYNLIWAEWFRDQNLQDSPVLNTGDTGDAQTHYPVRRRGKRHDYFTSCLPWPQKGDAVSLPLGTTAPVQAIDDTDGPTFARLGSAGADDYGLLNQTGVGTVLWQNDDTDGAAAWLDPHLQADLSTATAATINDLRLAFQTQRLLERDARSGTRYNELILSHFGVTVPDFRVQRPEFLGGGSSPININPVAVTTAAGTGEVTGNLAATGTVSGTHGFTKSFVEHGVVIGLVNVRSDITYSQGLERYWSKSTRFDFYYPVLSQIGEQSVLNKEIYHQGTGDDDNVFGYQERYAEYRYKPSRITGLFRTDASSDIDEWHLSEHFTSLPTLGDSFIQSNTEDPLDRAIAVPSEPQIIFDAYINLQCARPMPLYGVPGNLDHF